MRLCGDPPLPAGRKFSSCTASKCLAVDYDIFVNRLFITLVVLIDCKMDPEIITDEHAVLLDELPDTPSLLDYVKAVATVIGSKHIHSVFKDDSRIKVYLRDKKDVNTVISSGLVVRGQRTNVEFAVPPATKVVLLNVDPIVPDRVLKSLLESYGTLESSIIYPKLSDDVVYSHIKGGCRRVYMKISENVEVPRKMNLEYNNMKFQVLVDVKQPGRDSEESIMNKMSPGINLPKNLICKQSNSPESNNSSRWGRKRKFTPPQSTENSQNFSKGSDNSNSENSTSVDDEMFDAFSKANVDWDSLISTGCSSDGECNGNSKILNNEESSKNA